MQLVQKHVLSHFKYEYIFFHGKETIIDKKIIGTLFPQPIVQDKKGISSYLDDVLGNKFSLVCYLKNYEAYII